LRALIKQAADKNQNLGDWEMTKKMLVAVACLGAAMSFGQTMETTVKVTLPYDSKVGNVSLPAGSYSIREVMNSVLEISSDARNGVNTFVNVTPIVAPNHEVVDHTKVVLRHGENGYQVQKIWLEGHEMGFELNTASE
jgi:hypothetical protein